MQEWVNLQPNDVNKTDSVLFLFKTLVVPHTLVMTAEQSTEYCLVAIGNPLLDISAEVTPEFLEKCVQSKSIIALMYRCSYMHRYGLSANNAILADETHKPLYEDLVKEFKVDYIAGGAAQNSIRGAQWMLPPHSTSYFGCVGKDKYAEQMRAAANKDGVRTLYMEDASTATGTCAVLITNQGQNRYANRIYSSRSRLISTQFSGCQFGCCQQLQASSYYKSGKLECD